MKPYVSYGIGTALFGALATLVLFFAGVHNDVEKMKATNAIIGFVLGLGVPVLAVVLTLRATRNAAGHAGMSYGQGVLTSLLLGVVAGLLGAVFTYVYGAIINPTFYDTVQQVQIDAMEAKGMTQQQIDAATAMMSKFSGPVFASIMTVIGSPVFYTIIGLIVAIFFRRAPVETATPPSIPDTASS